MNGRIAIHSTHEAADKLGGIGTVLEGLLPEPDYQRVFPRSLLVGVYPFGAEESVIDDPLLADQKGWRVRFDSRHERPGQGRLERSLAEVAKRYGVRLVYGQRDIVRGLSVPVLVASPQRIQREPLDRFRRGLRDRLGFDLERFDDYPAVTDRIDRRLTRLLAPGTLAPDVPEQLVLDRHGHWMPGGAGWVDQRALFPPVPALDAFCGYGRANKYLLELQFHTFAAPALWAGVRGILNDWAPADDGYDPAQVTLFAHDWLGVPLWWAMRVAGDTVGQSVYFAHEARIFRLLAEGAMQDRTALLRTVCHPDGYDAALYPHLQTALEKGWDLAAMFPGTVGFPDVFHHLMNREAAGFDRIVAVGPLVRDETTVSLRPLDHPPLALCPNGIPAAPLELATVDAARSRLSEVAERQTGFTPDVIFTGVMRCELSKAPWRNVELFRRFLTRLPEIKAVFFWLSAPKPRPTRAQVQRRTQDYRWPLDHRGGESGDLRPEEEGLWQAIAALNQEHAHGRMFYINQFGWSHEALGALDPGESTFEDLRRGTDVEVGLSIYEPFGIAPLEPLSAGAVCVLSDACGCARHLESLGLDDLVVIGRFTAHDTPPREVDAATLKEIERVAYDAIIDDLASRLGLGGDEAERLERRASRLAAAGEAVEKLSWGHALRAYLLPALAEAPATG